MMCWYHRWVITRSADARRAVPPPTQAHLAVCASCRALCEICMRLPRKQALVDPQIITAELRQRILMRTIHAPRMARSAPSFLQAVEALGLGFSDPWKKSLAVLAVACLLVVVVWSWPQRISERSYVALGALQEVNGLYDQALTDLAATPWSNLLDQPVLGEYQRLTEEATATANYFGGLLPTVPRAVSASEAGRSS